MTKKAGVKFAMFLEVRDTERQTGGAFALTEDVLRRPDLQMRLTPAAKRKFERIKAKLRAAGMLNEIPYIGPHN
jgi:hypothetical protein